LKNEAFGWGHGNSRGVRE